MCVSDNDVVVDYLCYSVGSGPSDVILLLLFFCVCVVVCLCMCVISVTKQR